MQIHGGRHYAVVGAGYGDEGKGLVTDYIAREVLKSGKPAMVVRHNGTAQATHTVCVDSAGGRKTHRFSHFGAGTLANVDTFLWKTFFTHPAALSEETIELRKLMPGLPRFYVHGECPIVLPIDVIISQMRAVGFGHGSCGMGMFPAWQREQKYPGLLNVKTAAEFLEKDKLGDLLDLIDEHYYRPLLGDDAYDEAMAIVETNNLHIKFLHGIESILASPAWHICNDADLIDFARYGTLVFEGAQGLGLDPNFGQMPHCTPSDCGIKNPCDILSLLKGKPSLEAYYVTRAYATRHGAGPFLEALEHVPMRRFRLPPSVMRNMDTNSTNEMQGHIRYGELDQEVLGNRIRADINKHIYGPNATKVMLYGRLFVTWVDALDYESAANRYGHAASIANNASMIFGGLSYGPTSRHVCTRDDIEEMERFTHAMSESVSA